MSRLDSISINHYLNKFIDSVQTDDKTLPLSVASTYAKHLRSSILDRYRKQERVNSVVVLGRMVDYLPKEESIFELYDNEFFNELKKIAKQKLVDLTGDSIIKIMNFCFENSLDHCKGFFKGPTNGISFIEVLPARINLGVASDETICLTFEFISYLYLNLYKLDELTEMPIANEIWQCLCLQNYPMRLKDYYEQNRGFLALEKYQEFMENMRQGTQSYLQSPHSNESFMKNMVFLGHVLEKYNFEPRATKEDSYEMNGFTRDLKSFVMKQYSPFALKEFVRVFSGSKISINNGSSSNQDSVKPDTLSDDKKDSDSIGVISKETETLKKKFYQQILLASSKNCFPFAKIFLEIVTFLTNEFFRDSATYPTGTKFVQFYDSFLHVLLFSCLEYWEDSKAELLVSGDKENDVYVVVQLMKSVCVYAESVIRSGNSTGRNSGSSIDQFLKLLKTLNYKTAREEQLKQLIIKRQISWGQDVESFDNRLELEVANFVKEERTLQLMKGTWFYAEDPRSSEKFHHLGSNNGNGAGNGNTNSNSQNIPTTRHKKVRKLFVSLAPNRQFLLFKEFVTKQGAHGLSNGVGSGSNNSALLEKSSSKTVMLGSIKSIKIEDLSGGGSQGSSNGIATRHMSMFVNIRSKNCFQNITLQGKNNEALTTFYTDSNDTALVWADGVKLLLNKPISSVSDLTKSQIEKLFDVRRAVQFSAIMDKETLAESKSGPLERKGSAGFTTEEDEELYDYDELIKAADGYYYD